MCFDHMYMIKSISSVDIPVFIEYALKSLLNTHVEISSGARGLKFCLSLQLYPKVSECDLEIPQSHTVDQHMAP